MNCPRCEHDASRVLESRVPEAGDTIRRRRECLDCRYRFTTYERVEKAPLWVRKHDGREEPFSRSKLLGGLVRACSKRHVSSERLEALVISIESDLRSRCSRAVSSDDIGESALQGLRAIDDVAYVRFASVYRAFDNVGEFQLELELLHTTGARDEHTRNNGITSGNGTRNSASPEPVRH